MLLERLYKSFKQNPDLKLVNILKIIARKCLRIICLRIFWDVILDHYAEDQAAFSKLVGAEDSYYKTVYSLIAKDLYKWFRAQI